ncbi:patatin-like phospholipase family protein [Nitrosococcus wardiae]|uniref:patatin-like phospholipase family protein n=1 Tax=Nitrosococcus wardiae TaxID=1814290 RepID=UPI001F0FC3ED|nr:patatin-like phospholipase family protein [Nitrosococcus wardiae]
MAENQGSEKALESNFPILTAEQVLEQERRRLQERRRQARLAAGQPEKDAVGLTFSGGGIRSATFNLGLLQAMHRYGFLKHVDYLSTVSGGGYIGSSLTWFMSCLKQDFPFGTSRRDNTETPGAIVSWLRQHASYLTPGEGIDLWALSAAIIRGTLVNLLVIIPILFVVTVFLVWLPGPVIMAGYPHDGFTALLLVGLASLALLGITSIFYALFSSFRRLQRFRLRHRTNFWMGRMLFFGAGFVVLGTIPFLHGYLDLYFEHLIEEFNTSFSLAGVLSLVAGWIGRDSGKELKGYRKVLLNVGLALAAYGLLQWMYHGADAIVNDGDVVRDELLRGGIILSILIGVLANINYVSIHRYYRDRLLEAFMPPVDFTDFSAPNKCLLKDVPQTTAPYQIINTMMMTWNSSTPKLRIRGGDNFIFTPLFCGAQSTGYAPSTHYLGGTMDLSTAFSISGAAIDPNTGVTRSRPLSFMMTLLNLRVGYWARNPKRPARIMKGWSRPYWLIYSLREMFGLKMDENQMHIYLSDGGHFENLGLYELIRRRCRYIVLCDAAED